MTRVDWDSKFLLVACVLRQKPDLGSDAVVSLPAAVGNACHTITFDNGKEFASYQLFSDSTVAKVYFATPYHSCQRDGSRLPANGHGLANVWDAEVRRMREELNGRSRKVLGLRILEQVLIAVNVLPAIQAVS